MVRHSPKHWDSFTPPIARAGYNTFAVALPSVISQSDEPVESLQQDVDAVQVHIHSAVDAGQKVVLCMHSYGGIPGSEAVVGLDQASQAALGHKDGRGVVHLFYVAAGLLSAGQAWIDVNMYNDTIPEWLTFTKDNRVHMCNQPEELLYHDFEDKAEVQRMVGLLNPWSFRPGNYTKVTHEPWKNIAATYLHTTKDRIIEMRNQIKMVQNVRDAGARDLRCVALDSGHTPFGSMPEKVAELLLEAAVASDSELVVPRC